MPSPPLPQWAYDRAEIWLQHSRWYMSNAVAKTLTHVPASVIAVGALDASGLAEHLAALRTALESALARCRCMEWGAACEECESARALLGSIGGEPRG